MGWLYSTGWQTASAVRDHLREQLISAGHEIVADASTAYGRHYYAAVKDKLGRTTIFVALINGSRNQGWGYKDMDECSGPNDIDCPLKVLDKADPIDVAYPLSEGYKADEDGARVYATNWRAKVRAYHALRGTLAALKPGDIIHTHGGGHYVFSRWVKKSAIGTWLGNGQEYRVPLSRIARITLAEVVGAISA